MFLEKIPGAESSVSKEVVEWDRPRVHPFLTLLFSFLSAFSRRVLGIG